jgi:hypothetical protein
LSRFKGTFVARIFVIYSKAASDIIEPLAGSEFSS